MDFQSFVYIYSFPLTKGSFSWFSNRIFNYICILFFHMEESLLHQPQMCGRYYISKCNFPKSDHSSKLYLCIWAKLYWTSSILLYCLESAFSDFIFSSIFFMGAILHFKVYFLPLMTPSWWVNVVILSLSSQYLT